MKYALVVFLVAAPALADRWPVGAPATTNNDDSCDIAVQPAATLLLPYFEVDVAAAQSSRTTTLFTIQNVGAAPVTANVTFWTDWSFPAVNFPIQLTGYDVKGINLYDIFTSGALPPSACGTGTLSPGLVTDLRLIFTAGRAGGFAQPCSAQIGGAHALAIGYVTIDIVDGCVTTNATSPAYFFALRYDNVLTGDYQQLGTTGGHVYASSGPLVHIRAIPEGGAAGAVVPTSLPYTFYNRYTPDAPAKTMDRRQPLPSVFAMRYIANGLFGFDTTWKIWREGVSAGTCSGAQRASLNSTMIVTDNVRFDEHENSTVYEPSPYGHLGLLGMTVTASLSASDTNHFPLFSTSGDVAGWLYLNLDNASSPSRASQNWVITSMVGAPTYATEATATALGNGCSPKVRAGAQIGPLP